MLAVKELLPTERRRVLELWFCIVKTIEFCHRCLVTLRTPAVNRRLPLAELESPLFNSAASLRKFISPT